MLVGHILPAVLLAVAVNIPKFLETEVEVEGDTSYIAVTELRMSREYSLYYQHWTRFIFLGILPFIILLGLNLKIFIQIFKVIMIIIFKVIMIMRIMMMIMILQVSSFKKDRRSSVLLLLLVAVFLLCHAPRLALNLYEALDFEGVARWAGIAYNNNNNNNTIICPQVRAPRLGAGLLHVLQLAAAGDQLLLQPPHLPGRGAQGPGHPPLAGAVTSL